MSHRDLHSFPEFGTYLQSQQVDALRRRRIALSMMAASYLTAGMVAALWVVDALAISPVRPPKPDFLTLSFHEIEMVAATPPAAPKSDPAPARSQEAPADEASELDLVPPEKIPRLSPPSLVKSPKNAPFGNQGLGGGPGRGLNLSTSTGSGNGNGSAKGGNDFGTSASRVNAVMARAIYKPAPPTELLAQTRTARGARTTARVVVHFCVDAGGKTSDVRIAKGFPNDAQIDKIVADTVRKWRFRPMTVAGKSHRQCGEQSFQINWK